MTRSHHLMERPVKLNPIAADAAVLILPLIAGQAALALALVASPPSEALPQHRPVTASANPVRPVLADVVAEPQTRPADAVFGPGKPHVAAEAEPAITYAKGRTIESGGTTIYIAAGDAAGAAHPDPGYLGVWYLDHVAKGYRLRAAYPRLVAAGTFGNAPEWKLVTRYARPHPVAEITGSGMWFGDAYEWTSLIELAPDRPRVLFANILTARDFDPDPDSGEPPHHFSTAITYDPRRDVFLLAYRGDDPGTAKLACSASGYAPGPGQRLRGQSDD